MNQEFPEEEDREAIVDLEYATSSTNSESHSSSVRKIAPLGGESEEREKTSDKLWSTADAIDALLDEALAYRSDAVKHFKSSDKNVQRYQHAKMYSQLSKLPKSKISIFQQLTKTRQELASLRERFDKANVLHRTESRQLRHSLQALEKKYDVCESQRSELEVTVRKLSHENRKQQEKLNNIEAQHSKQIAQERTLRSTLERQLKGQLESQRKQFEAEKQALLDRQAQLELEVDEFRAKAAAGQLSLLELEYGLRGHHLAFEAVSDQLE